jgi:phospholipase/carboxylesterase
VSEAADFRWGSDGVRIAGALEGASAAVLVLHGRGARAEDFLPLGLGLVARARGELGGPGDPVVVAPQARGGTWYPRSFLAPLEANQPWLDSALATVTGISRRLAEAGIPRERQVLAGFSQGACLACELVLREGGRWGGLAAFTGGRLGPLGEARSFAPRDGALDGTPALLSSGDPDPHVPFTRVEETAGELRRHGAIVEVDRYPGRPHTVLPEELDRAVESLGLPGLGAPLG